MSHKDFLGNDLQVGDAVIFYCWRQLNEGRIIRQTPKGFTIGFEHWDRACTVRAKGLKAIRPHPVRKDAVIYEETVFAYPRDVAKVVMV